MTRTSKKAPRLQDLIAYAYDRTSQSALHEPRSRALPACLVVAALVRLGRFDLLDALSDNG